MLIGIIGRQGSGKSLSMSILAYTFSIEYKIPVFANYDLISAKKISTLSELMSLKNCIICVDEFHQNMDSRLFKDNVNLSAWINQVRKKDIILIYSTQHLDQVDKRVRLATDFIIQCDKTKNGDIWLSMIDTYDNIVHKRFVLRDPQRYYNLYDSYVELKALH